MRHYLRRLSITDVIIGLSVVAFLLLFYGNSLWQLLRQQSDARWLESLNDDYFWHILRFSFLQAWLSAVLSIITGLFVAHAFFYQRFVGKTWLLKLFSLTMVLPVLVAIFGLLGVYGRAGWLSQIMSTLGVDWRPNIYGLTGILLAHVFFNLPLSVKIFLHTLQSIPPQQRQLAEQLGILDLQVFRLIEWPYLRQQLLPVFTLVFMLCFTSFTIVLALGGGPKYTTLEVAIYQALTFDFELQKAAVLALVQFMICLFLFQLSSYLSRHTDTQAGIGYQYVVALSPIYYYGHRLLLIVATIFVILPLLQVVISAMDIGAWQHSLANPTLWRALAYSLAIAPTAGLLSLLMAFALLIGARQLHWHGLSKLSMLMINTGMMVLAVPTLVLSVGLFLLLQQYTMSHWSLFVIIVLCNALLAMPFALRFLSVPFYNNMIYYERLCQSLGISGWARWRLIEWQTLKQPSKSALALATALSLGDFTAIALFGNEQFTSLPRLLYQQLGQYRSQEAAVTALLLLVFSAFIFLLIERYDDDSATIRNI